MKSLLRNRRKFICHILCAAPLWWQHKTTCWSEMHIIPLSRYLHRAHSALVPHVRFSHSSGKYCTMMAKTWGNICCQEGKNFGFVAFSFGKVIVCVLNWTWTEVLCHFYHNCYFIKVCNLFWCYILKSPKPTTYFISNGTTFFFLQKQRCVLYLLICLHFGNWRRHGWCAEKSPFPTREVQQ